MIRSLTNAFWRSLVLAVLFSTAAFAQTSPYPGQVCNATAVYSASTSGLTQMVAAVANARVWVCSYRIVVGAVATNVGLSTGTGSNCGTNTAALTPLWVLLASGQLLVAEPFGNSMTTPPGNALCVNTSGANAVQVEVRYSQVPGQ